MDFENATAIPSSFLGGSTGDYEMLGIFASKVTYRLVEGQLEAASAEDSWPVFESPFEFRGVTFPVELDFRRSGVDIVIFGDAKAPGGRPISRMTVGVRCGRVRHELDVVGERRWIRSGGKLVASEPEPFVEAPLTNDRSFGGKARWKDVEMMHTENPDGRGFYLSEEDAEGGPLPGLERPEAPIGAWDDHPSPGYLYKTQGPPPPTGDIRDESTDHIGPLMDTVLHAAATELIADPADLGPEIRLTGFSAEGDIVMPTPALLGPTAHVSAGTLNGRFLSELASVVVLAPERVLIASYVGLFRYLFRPHEKRRCVLRWDGGVRGDERTAMTRGTDSDPTDLMRRTRRSEIR